MRILHVRSVPSKLYERLQKFAQAHNRSLSAQVITMLSQAVETEERRQLQAEVLNSIRSRRFSVPEDTPSTLALLHEDRVR